MSFGEWGSMCTEYLDIKYHNIGHFILNGSKICIYAHTDISLCESNMVKWKPVSYGWI